MTRMLELLATFAMLLAASTAHSASSARILETHPATDATLGRQETFWVRIEYTSDEPVSLWVRPFRNGNEVKQAMSNASLSYVGSGQALGWFALTEPGEVDEIRITAGGGQPYREWELARQPVRLDWTDATPSARQLAPWVEEALAIEKARYAEDARSRAEQPVTKGDMVLMNGFMLAVLALFVAGIGVPLWTAWKWRGRWRIAAALSAGAVLFVVLRIVVDTARDPTSHNLWPFEILQAGVVALAIIALLKLARRFLGVQP